MYNEKVARRMQSTIGENSHDEENLTASKGSEEPLLNRGIAVNGRFLE